MRSLVRKPLQAARPPHLDSKIVIVQPGLSVERLQKGLLAGTISAGQVGEFLVFFHNAVGGLAHRGSVLLLTRTPANATQRRLVCVHRRVRVRDSLVDHKPISIVRKGPLMTGNAQTKRTARFPVNTRQSVSSQDDRRRPEIVRILQGVAGSNPVSPTSKP